MILDCEERPDHHLRHVVSQNPWRSRFALTATASSSLTVTFSATGSCSVSAATVHLTGTGSCTITASQTGDSNYNAAPDVPQSFSTSKGSQTITFAALSAKAFGDPDFALTATASSSLTVTFSATGSCSVSAATVHLTGAGSCTITASQTGDSNYSAAPDVPQSFSTSRAARPSPSPPCQPKPLGIPISGSPPPHPPAWRWPSPPPGTAVFRR